MTALGTWITDWREQRLNLRQWLFAALALACAASGYCLLSGLAAGERAPPSLSLAWGALVVVVFSVGCCLVSGWLSIARGVSALRVSGTVILLAGTVIALVCGEKWLAQLYWERPWTDFGAHVASRAPLGLLVLAIVRFPAWLKSANRTQRRSTHPPSRPPSARAAILSVPTRSGPRELDATQIVRIQAAGNYVELHSSDGIHLLRTTLGSLAERLADSGFVRVHRSAMINRHHIRSIGRDSHGEWLVHLADGTEVRAGRRFREAITHLQKASGNL